MTNFIKKAALAATASAVAFGATPALAAPTSAQATGTATVKIYSPLSITTASATDAVVDFGILVGTLGGALPRSTHDFVIDPTTAPTAAALCTGATNWSCSGSPHRATFTVSGSTDAVVNVWADPSITLTTGGGTANESIDLALTLDAGADTNSDGMDEVVLTGGSATVNVGGTLSVLDTNVDGVYSGSFNLNADYQ